MAIEDMNSMWQYMESFRIYFKGVMASSLKSITEWGAYFKTQMGAGFQYAYEGLSAFIQNLPAMAKYAWHKAIEWLVQGFHYGQRFLKFMLDIATNLIRNIPYYVQQTWLFVKDCASVIKDILIKLYEVSVPFLKAAWNALTTFVSTLARHAWEAFQIAFRAVAKRVFMGIGIIYGISSVLVESMGYGLNALTSKAFGLNLANYAAFGAIQTGLSITLATLCTAAVLYYGYKATCYLFRTAREHINAIHQHLQRQTQEVQPQAEPAQTQEAQPEPEEAPATYLPRLRQQRRNQTRQEGLEGQDQSAPRRSTRTTRMRAVL